MKRLIDSLCGLLGRAGRAARALSLAGAALAIALPASAGETVTHIHNDPFGTPVLATDAAGNVVWKETYRPYGSKLNNQPASVGNKIGFTGQPFDASTGLSYMRARYYDPVLGRFMGVDPAPPSLDNVHSLNRYTYANNNPYRYVDPDGRAGVLAWTVPPLLIGGGWWTTRSAEQQDRMIRDAGRAASWVRGLVFNEGAEGGGTGAADARTAWGMSTPASPPPDGDDPREPRVYRGGDKLEARTIDVRIDKATGLVKPGRGVSLGSDAEALTQRFGSAREITSIPDELQIVRTSGNHFEIAPRAPMTMERYQKLLNQVGMK